MTETHTTTRDLHTPSGKFWPSGSKVELRGSRDGSVLLRLSDRWSTGGEAVFTYQPGMLLRIGRVGA